MTATPESVVHPSSDAEVAEIMIDASREGVGIFPLSSGHRAHPVRGERPYLELSTTRLDGIVEYEPADLTLTARAGTSLATIDEALRAHGQWAPFDPPNVGERSIGGLAAVGDSGPLWMGYGELRNHVLGMTVVTGDGRMLSLGGRVVKNVAGYDLLKPMVGSRGSLAVVTSVCLRVYPEPSVDRVLLLRRDRLSDLVAAAHSVGTAPVMPVSSVLVDRTGVNESPALVIRLHGVEETVGADQASLEGHLGIVFEQAPSATALCTAVRDRGATSNVVLVASALPSALSEVIRALERLEPETIVADTYAARFRVGLSQADPEAVGNARASIERLGGTLRVARFPADGAEVGPTSEPSPAEKDLIIGIEKTLDPMGVLWPARSRR